ncbi:hypothetical protein FSP39_005282 [Pinctada imbricata]|uniref:Uncharacterized protein n=1 Tax=Pinctada imbricata TaxID=66713 RepID=A0AA88YN33_PINIB|nr:hypothetical protein FSP39_005282 [Pinctada imbricata]
MQLVYYVCTFYFALFGLLGPVQSSEVHCPKDCTCRKQVVKCMQVIHFPWEFPARTTKISFDEMTVSEIPPNAFKGLNDLVSVEFTRSNIGSVSQCAFKSAPHLASVKFTKCVIGVVKPAAFNVDSKEKLSIKVKDSQITTMEPYAFYQLNKMEKRSFKDTTIHDVQTRAFYGIHNVASFSFMSCDFRKVRNEAFANINKVSDLQIKRCKFHDYACKAFDGLMANSHYEVTENRFRCDCGLNWLVTEKDLQKLWFVSNSTCMSPTKVEGKELKDVFSTKQACSQKNQKETTCKKVAVVNLPDDACPVRQEDEHSSPGDHSHGRGRQKKPDNSANMQNWFNVIEYFMILMVAYMKAKYVNL